MSQLLNRLLFGLAATFVTVDGLWLAFGHFAIDLHAYGLLALLVVPLVLASAWYGRRRAEEGISAALAVTAFLVVFPAAAALMSYLLITIAGPRIDGILASADMALGFHWPALMAWAGDHPLLNTLLGGAYMSVMPQTLLLILLLALATHELGIFPIFGAFLAGTLLHDDAGLRQAWRDRVGHFVGIFLLPVFFTYTGLRTDIGSLSSASLWSWCLGFAALATLSKFGAAYVAARVSGWSAPASCAVGIMMNTRALMELIVLNIGLDLQVISRPLFTMLVIMAILSTVATSPILRLCLARLVPGTLDAKPPL